MLNASGSGVHGSGVNSFMEKFQIFLGHINGYILDLRTLALFEANQEEKAKPSLSDPVHLAMFCGL